MQFDEFLDQLKRHFGYLFQDYDFEIRKVECARAFGNCLAVLEAELCRITISKDRSQVIVDISPSFMPKKSYSLPFVVGFLDQAAGLAYNPLDLSTEIYSHSEEKQWELVGDLLEQHSPAILRLFQQAVFPREQEHLETYVREKVAEHMERLHEKAQV